MEILAPAGTKEAFNAALAAGADAIYIGGKNYSARAYADNFSFDDIKECIQKAHLLNVKVHIVVNTLLYEDELYPCFETCKEYIKLGVDALIIQDLGLISLISKAYKDFPIHASTQLNVHNLKEAEFLEKIGVKRIVLARETPLDEIIKIKRKTHLEVEVFAHGALCVSCSGQCLMSSFIGNRSGNRGRCAQPCRMEGRIISNNTSSNLIYPLSMKDLCTLEYVHEFEKAQIDSLKIEGRMKSPEYIYQCCKAYKEALNGKLDYEEAMKKIKVAFNREYTKGFILNETRNHTLNQKSSSHIGIEIGKITKVTSNSFFMILKEDLSLHDGLKDKNNNEGFLLTHFKLKGEDVHYAKKGDYVEVITKNKGYKVNDIILKTKSSALEEETKKALSTVLKRNINCYFYAKENQKLSITLYDDLHSYNIESDFLMQKANNSYMSKEELYNRLNKSDTYPFNISHIDFDIDGGLFYSIKDLNNLRRKAYEGFYNLLVEDVVSYKESELFSYNLKECEEKEKVCFAEKEEQIEEIIKYPFNEIYVNENLYNKYHQLDNRIKLNYKRMGEDYYNEEINASSYPMLNSTFMTPYGNVLNHEALALLLNYGYKNICLSYESSFENSKKIIESFVQEYHFKPNVYFPIYGYIDLMLLKSCMIATYYKKEKLPCLLCKKDDYYFADRKGVMYPLFTNNDCYTKVLSNKVLSLLDKKELIEEYFLPYINFTIENKMQTINALNAYFDDEKLLLDSFEGHFYQNVE